MRTVHKAQPLFYREHAYQRNGYSFTEFRVYSATSQWLKPIGQWIDECVVPNYTSQETADRVRLKFNRMRDSGVTHVADTPGLTSVVVDYTWQHYRSEDWPAQLGNPPQYCQAAVKLPESPYSLAACYRLHTRLAQAMDRANRHHQWHEPQALRTALARLRAVQVSRFALEGELSELVSCQGPQSQ